MSWYDGLLGRIDPSTAGGGQLAGLLNGLGAMGAGLVQAGQFRPVSQPGPSVADAFAAFGTGRQQGLLNAYQQGQMNQRQRRQALIAEAQSAKPDADISTEAQAMRRALSGMPDDVRTLASPDELPTLALDRARNRTTPLDAARLQTLGLRPGTAGMENAWTGGVNILQQPDTMSDDAFNQKARLALLGRQPQVQWRDERDATGNVIGQRSSTGQLQPIATPPMNRGQAANIVSRLGPMIAAGTVAPGTPDFDRYTMAYDVVTQPVTEMVANPQMPGTLIPIQRPRTLPGQFPDPMQIIQRAGAAPPQQPQPAAPPQQPAPTAEAQGVQIPGTAGMTATPPPAPLLPRDQSGTIRATPAAIEALRKGEIEAARVADAIQNFREVLKENGTGLSTYANNPRDPKAQKVLAAYERVKMIMRGEGLMNTGVLQPGENVMLEHMLLSPSSWRGAVAGLDSYDARLGQIEKQMLDSYNANRKQAGLPPLPSLRGVGAGAAAGGGQGWVIRYDAQGNRIP